MIRSIVYCLPLILFLLSVAVIDAQQPKKMARIGYLTLSAANSEWDEVFKQAFGRWLTCHIIISLLLYLLLALHIWSAWYFGIRWLL